MYPPRVNTAEVLGLIRQLTRGARLPSGAAVRAALQTQFGSRGGVARIYRLLAEERLRLTPAPRPGSIEELQLEVHALREKLTRAEQREDAHQIRWAAEVDRLRLTVATLEPLVQQATSARASMDLLRHQLRAAEQRAANLEQRLMVALEQSAPTQR
jgi:hypothetical protein